MKRLAVSLLIGSTILAGCASGPTAAPNKAATSADSVVERVVAQAQGDNGEIVGYLVDAWGRDGGLFEHVVTKSGDVLDVRNRSSHYRPNAAFGAEPYPRLAPESAEEGAAREAALNRLKTAMTAKTPPEFSPVKLVVYQYLVRVRESDGSQVDYLARPDGSVTETSPVLVPWSGK